MPRIPQNGRLHRVFHARKSPKWAASPPILGGSGHEIKGVADHFGGFRAWIPERSDFFKGPKGPKGPLGPGGLIKSSIIRTYTRGHRNKKCLGPGRYSFLIFWLASRFQDLRNADQTEYLVIFISFQVSAGRGSCD